MMALLVISVSSTLHAVNCSSAREPADLYIHSKMVYEAVRHTLVSSMLGSTLNPARCSL